MLSYEKKLLEITAADPSVLVMTAENRAPMKNIVGQLGDRFIDTGITEQAMIGTAAGLALRGRKPICHALAPFLTMRAFEFIRTDVGIPGLPVTIVGFIPGVLSDGNGPTHQALEDISIMRGVPGMQVFAPADEAELADALPQIIASGKPSYIRWHQAPAVVEHKPFQIGKAEVLETGTDVNILTYGYLLREVTVAAALLRSQGLSVGVTNMRTLSPVDEAAIVAAARAGRMMVTVEDHFLRGGLSTIVAETCFKHRLNPISHAIGLETWFKAGRLADVLKQNKLDSQGLAARIVAQFEEAARV